MPEYDNILLYITLIHMNFEFTSNEADFESTLNNWANNPQVLQQAEQNPLDENIVLAEINSYAKLLPDALCEKIGSVLKRPKLILLFLSFLITFTSSIISADAQQGSEENKEEILKAIQEFKSGEIGLKYFGAFISAANLTSKEINSIKEKNTLLGRMNEQVLANYIFGRISCEQNHQETGLVAIPVFNPDNSLKELITTGIVRCGHEPHEGEGGYGVSGLNIPKRYRESAQIILASIPNVYRDTAALYNPDQPLNDNQLLNNPTGGLSIPLITTGGKQLAEYPGAYKPLSEVEVQQFVAHIENSLENSIEICSTVKDGLSAIEVKVKDIVYTFCTKESPDDNFVTKPDVGSSLREIMDIATLQSLTCSNNPNNPNDKSFSLKGKHMQGGVEGCFKIFDKDMDAIVFINRPIDYSEEVAKGLNVLLGALSIFGVIATGATLLIVDKKTHYSNKLKRKLGLNTEAENKKINLKASNIASDLAYLESESNELMDLLQNIETIDAFMYLIDRLANYTNEFKDSYYGELLNNNLEERGFDQPGETFRKFSVLLNDKTRRSNSGELRKMVLGFFTLAYNNNDSEKYREIVQKFVAQYPDFQHVLGSTIDKKIKSERTNDEVVEKEISYPIEFYLDNYNSDAENIPSFLNKILKYYFNEEAESRIGRIAHEQILPVVNAAIESIGDFTMIKKAIGSNNNRIKIVDALSTGNSYIVLECTISAGNIKETIYFEFDFKQEILVPRVFVGNAGEFLDTTAKRIQTEIKEKAEAVNLSAIDQLIREGSTVKIADYITDNFITSDSYTTAQRLALMNSLQTIWGNSRLKEQIIDVLADYLRSGLLNIHMGDDVREMFERRINDIDTNLAESLFEYVSGYARAGAGNYSAFTDSSVREINRVKNQGEEIAFETAVKKWVERSNQGFRIQMCQLRNQKENKRFEAVLSFSHKRQEG